MGIMRMLQQRRTRKAFQEYIGPEKMAQILREAKQMKRLERRHFQFMVILIDDTNPEDIPAVINRVVGTIIQQGATLSTVTSSLLVGLFGVPFPEGDSPERRRGLVDALLQDHGDRIRLAHGQCQGTVGLLGNEERYSYGALIPGFSGVLKTLLETKFGTAVEVS